MYVENSLNNAEIIKECKEAAHKLNQTLGRASQEMDHKKKPDPKEEKSLKQKVKDRVQKFFS